MNFNLFSLILLIFLFLDFILNISANILNLSTLSPEIPEEFIDSIDSPTYAKLISYRKTKTYLGIAESLCDFSLLLGFWFCKGFNFLDQFISGISSHPILNGLLFIGILVFIRFIIQLPFTVYSTFVIEQRYGFNKTKLLTFVDDIIKGVFLFTLSGGSIVVVVLAFFQYAEAVAWIYCWVATVSFSFFVQYISPTWIMPHFNKFTPLPTSKLKSSIMEYAHSCGFPLGGIFVMDGSKRSTKANAFFTGFGKNKRIILFDTLIKNHTKEELISVLGHEIGHYKKKHILKMQLISFLNTGFMFFLLSQFLTQKELYNAFFMQQMPLYAGFIFFGLLYSPLSLVISLFINTLSRRHEFEADRFVFETTADEISLINTLKKLLINNLAHLTPHPFYVLLHYSHPPILKRISFLRSLKKASNLTQPQRK